MKTVSLSILYALAFGLTSCIALRIAFYPISLANFSHLIGLAAFIGAALGAWWGRRGASK